MIQFIATLKIAGALFGLTLGSVMLGEVANGITHDTTITLGSAVAACGAIAGCALYIGRWMQRVNDSVKLLQDHFKSLPCQPSNTKPLDKLIETDEPE